MAPRTWLDPSVPVLTGEKRTVRVGGVDVRVSLPGSGEYEKYDVGDVGFTCDGWAWRLTSGFGTADELLEAATRIVDHVGC